MKRLNQSGSHIVVAGLLLIAVALIGFTGYRVWQSRSTNDTITATTAQSSSAPPATIQSDADLTQAAKALDASSGQINSSLNDTALNSDLNDLL